MSYAINKAVVIGSGTMGGGIATLLAGVGVDVLLLDIPAKDTQPGDSPRKRNAIVEGNLKSLKKMRPPQLFEDAVLDRVSIGNIDDDLGKTADADWIIEVVVERLDIKQSLMAKLAEVANPNAIITTNTSGLPIHKIAEGLGADFKRRFMGTHFFNPPRYLRLLEIIPLAETDPAIVEFIQEFATVNLGKGVVIAKDEPNFIGNRFMSMVGMQAMNYALDHGYTVEEVDAITGPLIGRPKTATFNLNDLVGFDVAVYVSRNLYDAIPDDPQRDVLAHPAAAELSQYMLDNGMLGRKSGKGFYQMRRGDDGGKALWALDLQTKEYQPPTKPRFESVGQHRKVEPVGERIRLMMNADDRAGQFLWHHHAFYLAYASNRVPEITDNIVNIDNAQKWGFGHQLGPFEIWDAIGIAETVPAFEEAGYPVADWVKQMVDKGYTAFYQRDANGKVVGYFDVNAMDYVPLERDPMEITIADLRADGKQLDANEDGAVYDMGDGVLLWEFTSKQNTITAKFIDMGWRALELLDDPAYVALVISNDAERFSIGANLADSMAGGVEGIQQMIKRLQDLTQALRYAPKPVITAPFNMALGGGAEMMMAGTATVAHIELYAGLVEVGVGLIPAGAGCKELVRRVVNPLAVTGAYVLPAMQKIFEAIATAKVSESAKQARNMGLLGPNDKIVMNRARLLGEAKQYALALSKTYEPRQPEKVYAAGAEVYAAMLLGLEQFREAGYASDYDVFIGKRLAYILTGGALSEPQWVDQQLILDLERQVFVELMMQEKTQQRVMHMLQTNKPLRN
ncbi:MAG: 3-hydroxyacyl-CoA dehydrogenase/enoyl-CoA hydratase family protein [Anaerolineaceae bacterium]|nr:MAG: 3-hydroxyacyl-CoA dehydrogenase/enoyl-CoA hydratase family protein [Anaerolineaceae bacterium]